MKVLTKREQIIAAADQLFYQQGFEHTSFAHIAKAVNISRGNFYYHFKTKNQILDAVICLRLAKTQAMIEQWQLDGNNPTERIACFINILITNQAKIERFGCPAGTLTSELSKLEHPASNDASKVFTLFKLWLKHLFSQLGYSAQAEQLAMHLLARSQGVAVLASAFNNRQFIEQEVKQLHQWLGKYPDISTSNPL